MKQRKKRAKKGEPQTITKAVTHIRLEATNAGKLTALDQLSVVYRALTAQYTTLFCTDELPNGFRAPCFLTPLSDRYHQWHCEAESPEAACSRASVSGRDFIQNQGCR